MPGARLALSERKRADEELGKRIEDAYQNNRRVYGSPRLHAELKEQGVHCGRKRGARLMADAWDQCETEAEKNENDR